MGERIQQESLMGGQGIGHFLLHAAQGIQAGLMAGFFLGQLLLTDSLYARSRRPTGHNADKVAAACQHEKGHQGGQGFSIHIHNLQNYAFFPE